MLRRLGELRELGRPLYVSLSRKDLLGAVLAGSWEERLPAERARVGDLRRDGARGRAGRRRSSGCTTRARCRRCGSPRRSREPAPERRSSMASGTTVRGGAWEPALARGPRGRPPRRRELRAGDDGEAHRPARATSHPELAEALGRVGIESLYSHQAEAYETARERELILTSGTASGKSLSFNLPVLDGIAHDAEAPRLLPLPDQGARPGPGAQARPSCARRTCARRSTTATPRARSGPRSAAAPTWC